MGSSNVPVYFSGGKPEKCGYKLTDYLPLAGGIMTGDVYLNDNKLYLSDTTTTYSDLFLTTNYLNFYNVQLANDTGLKFTSSSTGAPKSVIYSVNGPIRFTYDNSSWGELKFPEELTSSCSILGYEHIITFYASNTTYGYTSTGNVFLSIINHSSDGLTADSLLNYIPVNSDDYWQSGEHIKSCTGFVMIKDSSSSNYYPVLGISSSSSSKGYLRIWWFNGEDAVSKELNWSASSFVDDVRILCNII